MRFIKILILFNFFIVVIAFSQENYQIGVPFIQNYSKKIYGSDAQNWSVLQDKKGVMYFGNNFGLLEFDGASWRLHELPKSNVVRSTAIDSTGRIFIGSSGHFGYFYANNQCRSSYQMLSDTIEDKFGDVWRVFTSSHGAYFFAGRDRIYRYHNNRLSQINQPDSVTEYRGFLVNDQIYAVDATYGLAVVRNDSLHFLNNLTQISGDRIYAILPQADGTWLMATAESGLYWYNPDNNQLQQFVNEANDYLIDNQLYAGIQMANGDFAFGTLLGGLVIMDKAGQVLKILNKSKGLPAEGIYYLYEDFEHNLWLGTENGIAHVWLNSLLNKFNEDSGLESSLSKLCYYNHALYLGTYGGIYYLTENSIRKPVENKAINLLTKDYFFALDFAEVHLPNSDKTILLAATLRNLVHVKDTNQIHKIHDLYGGYTIVCSKSLPGRVYIGHEKGLSAMDITYTSNVPQYSDLINFEEITESIREMSVDSAGNLWIGTARSGVVHVRFKNEQSLTEYQIYRFGTEHGLPNELNNYPYLFNNQILLRTERGIYRADLNLQDVAKTVFRPDTLILNYALDSISVVKLFPNRFGQLWLGTDKGFMLYKKSPDQGYTLQREPFNVITEIGAEMDVISIAPDKAWLAFYNALYYYDGARSFYRHNENEVLFRQIRFGKSNPVFEGYYQFGCDLIDFENDSSLSLIEDIPHAQNSVEIHFASNSLLESQNNLYQYKLVGYQDEWQKWTSDVKANYTNLSGGNYTFCVQSKNVWGEISPVSCFSFQVSPPWYLHWATIVGCFLLVSLLVYHIIRLNSKRLAAQNDQLEEIIQRRTQEIQQQKEEMQTQAEQLKAQSELLKLSNNELRQLSMVAKGTDNSVLILNEKGDFEWWNEGFTQLFRYKFQRFKGSNFNKIKHILRPDLHEKIGEMESIDHSVTYTTHEMRDESTDFWYQTTITPVKSAGGKIFRYIVIDSDITKVKKAESEIKKQHYEIELQRDKIARQNKEIKDSIMYASRIQTAMLPLELFIDAVLDDYFIFNKPRDIVSGDFYWAAFKNGKTVIVAADCTGHGIPGAFLSLLGISFLNSIIQRLEQVTAAEILNQLREKFIISLHQRGKQGEAHDGMDIAICVIENDKRELQFAGANNPLYLIRKGSDKIERTRPDKMPIGFHANDHLSFKNHRIPIEEGDIFYIFTDGYRDQFGGPLGKKFLSKRFKEYLVEISHQDMETQKQLLENTFNDWKGDKEQVDDVLVIGVKI